MSKGGGLFQIDFSLGSVVEKSQQSLAQTIELQCGRTSQAIS